MNHVWIVTLRSSAATLRLVAAKELKIKDRRCLVIDPSNAEVRVKIHWIPFHVSNDAVRKALEPFGKVTEVTRDTWMAEGFQGIESATRLVRITLQEGTTIDSLPHQLRLFGANCLIVVPGRAPLCLRCKRTGHIRRDCRVPRCSECHRFGHEAEDCVRTYASAVGRQETDPVNEMIMDADEAESTAASTAPAVLSPVCNDRDFRPEEQDRKPGEEEKTSVTTDEKKVSSSPEPQIEENSNLEQHSTTEEAPEVVEMPDASQASKRSLERSSEIPETENEVSEKEVPWKKFTTKKGRYNALRTRQNSQ